MYLYTPDEIDRERTHHQAVILVHNHPSNNNEPTPQDKTVTREIKKGLEIFDILNHVIISQNDHYSMKEHGDI